MACFSLSLGGDVFDHLRDSTLHFLEWSDLRSFAATSNMCDWLRGYQRRRGWDEVYVFDPDVMKLDCRTGKWTWETSMPTSSLQAGHVLLDGRQFYGVAVVEDTVFVISGELAVAPEDETLETDFLPPLHNVESYNTSTGVWNHCAPIPTARYGLAAVALDNMVYAIGGNTNAPFADGSAVVERYDPISDHWRSLAPMLASRDMLAAVAVGGSIYALGGGCPDATSLVERYDPVTNVWAFSAPLPFAMSSPVVMVSMHRVFAMNIENNPSQQYAHSTCPNAVPASIYSYDPATNEWSKLASMQSARHDFTAVLAEREILVFGGGLERHGQVQFLDHAERYDVSRNHWVADPQLLPPTSEWQACSHTAVSIRRFEPTLASLRKHAEAGLQRAMEAADLSGLKDAINKFSESAGGSSAILKQARELRDKLKKRQKKALKKAATQSADMRPVAAAEPPPPAELQAGGAEGQEISEELDLPSSRSVVEDGGPGQDVERASNNAGPLGTSIAKVVADAGEGVNRSTADASMNILVDQVPPHLSCPITSELMTDPVFTADGQTYERWAIQSWLERGNQTSPLTGQTLEHLMLTPNIMCRGLCRDFLDAHPHLAPQPAALPSTGVPVAHLPSEVDVSQGQGSSQGQGGGRRRRGGRR